MESSPTCSHYHAELKASSKYWKSPKGIRSRIDSLAQTFNYRVVNNAIKLIGPQEGAKWLRWKDYGDANVCEDCRAKARGGSKEFPGYYKVTWFLPVMPVHPRCRCQWEIIFGEPMVQTRL